MGLHHPQNNQKIEESGPGTMHFKEYATQNPDGDLAILNHPKSSETVLKLPERLGLGRVGIILAVHMLWALSELNHLDWADHPDILPSLASR